MPLRPHRGQSRRKTSSRDPGAHKRGVARAALAGWGEALGSKRVPIAQVECEFELPAGKLAKGAGLKTVRRAAPKEDEVSLARAAAQKALARAGVAEEELDWIVATSETRVGVPSLGASLHSALLAPESCGVLDVGGQCGGVANCLIVADALCAAGKARCVLIASADVHSRVLTPGKVPGKFGGLFGDGASAFVVQPAGGGREPAGYRLLTSLSGCAASHGHAIRVEAGREGDIILRFEGEALARAAVDRMAQVLDGLEAASGRSHQSAGAFVIHQPNPRLVETFARRAGVPLEKIPLVGRSAGNLGSSTCGVALSRALDQHGRKPAGKRGPIFVAALGPGLLWQGMVLE